MPYIHIYIYSTNIPPIMIINRIYENQILLSLYFVSFLVGLRTYQHSCIVVPRYILVIMRNVSERSCRESQNTHFILNNFLLSENRAVSEIMWKNVLQLERAQITI